MKIKVSIVEDDAQAREIFAAWINSAEDLQCASEHPSAEHALKSLPRAEPDVVLMDINLGGMNGVECVRRLKPSLPDTQFIMLTVYEDADHIFEALRAGATGYLLKRAQCAELLTAVRDVHQGGSPMTPNIARKLVRTFQRSSTCVPAMAELSNREKQVLELLSQGYLYKEIAEALEIRLPTVATYIRLSLRLETNALELLIQDDGCGFDPARFSSPNRSADRFAPGNGLANIRNRLGTLNGTVNFDSSGGKGTVVSLRVPLVEELSG